MLNNDEVKVVANLARLKQSDGEIEKMKTQLEGIFHWLDQLQNVDTSALTKIDEQTIFMKEREDMVTEKDQVEQIMPNAPSSEYNMFVVPKMVE